MNKKGLFIIILCLLTLFSISGCDPNESADTNNLFDTIKNNALVQGLFGQADGQKSLADDIIMMRLLFAILIFAVIYSATAIVMKDFAKNSRIVIGIVIAIISVVAIPGDLLKIAAQTYGGFVLFVLLAVPIFTGLFLIFGVFKEPTRVNFGIRFAISMLLWGLVYKISDGAIITGTAEGVWGVIGYIASFATWIFAVMTLYFLIRTVSAGSGAEDKAEIPEQTKKAAKNVRKWWRRRGGPGFNRITNIIKNLYAAISTKNKEALEKAVKGISTIEKRTKDLEIWSYNEVKKFEDFEDTTLREKAHDSIQEAIAAHRAIAESLRKIKQKIPKGPIPDKDWEEIKTEADNIDVYSKTARSKEIEFLAKIK